MVEDDFSVDVDRVLLGLTRRDDLPAGLVSLAQVERPLDGTNRFPRRQNQNVAGVVFEADMVVFGDNEVGAPRVKEINSLYDQL